MKIISGPEPLTPQQIGALLLSATYKGQTVGQLFLATLSAMRTGDLGLIAGCPERALLLELGLSAQMLPSSNPGDAYVHILNAQLLYKKLPELKHWHTTLSGWYGVKLGGVPYLVEPGAVRRGEPLKRRAKSKPMLSLKESSALEKSSAALAKSSALPVESSATQAASHTTAHTATVIQFPGR